MSLKVLHLRSSSEFLGAERVVVEICKASRSLGVEAVCGVIQDTRDGRPHLLDVAEKEGIPTVVFVAHSRLDISCIRQITRYVQQEKIDIIHTHGYREDIYAWCARAGVPLVATNHLWKNTSLLLKLYSFVDGLVLHFFDKIAAVSHEIEKVMAERCLLPQSKLKLIPNGIDTTLFDNVVPVDLSSDLSIQIGSEVVLLVCVARLTEIKGHRFLLQALSSDAIVKLEWHLIIVGDGPAYEDLIRLGSQLGLADKVSFVGSRKDVDRILARCDIFVLPSLNEGLPMALLEAMSSKLACVATRVGDVPSVISAPEIGRLVTPGDVRSLAGALEDLIRGESLRETLGRKAREEVEGNFSSRRMAMLYKELYDQVL